MIEAGPMPKFTINTLSKQPNGDLRFVPSNG